ncbi:MAG TPA: glycosyltransferase family 4 protein [Solirubrobacteraceae bacterium]|jgi:glycosyltransferase involved in cell wall biosynthesis|nr:glycosyltransferase family 4 protein [Solirubrobacteraceae bacterium]
MRVLLLHNRYRAEGGEERAVRDLAALLRARGHEVGVLERDSGERSAAAAAAGLLRGGVKPEEVTAAVRRLRADVVHAHNLHPLLGWRALAAARSAGARTVLHLHNYRLFCAIAIAYRDGAPCARCHGRNTLPGLRLGCRGSLTEAAVYAAGLARQQPALLREADALVTVSAATATRLRAGVGAAAERAVVLPNFVAAGAFAAASRADVGTYALVAGRLVEEKGFDTAITAAGRSGVPLLIAGEGPDEPRLRALAAGAEVRFAGRLRPEALAEARAGAAVVLVPSRWEEPCPYAVLDAMAAGVPVLVSDRGGLPETVGPGEALPAEDTAAWRRALRELWSDPQSRRASGGRALERARARFGEDRYYEALLAVYSGDG